MTDCEGIGDTGTDTIGIEQETVLEIEGAKDSRRAGKIGLAVASISLCVLSVGAAPFLRRFTGAPYVSSSNAARAAIGNALRAHGGRRLVDLGSGSGEVVLDGARAGYNGTGYELNVWLVGVSRWRAWRHGLSSRARFVWGDMWTADLRGADAVVVFGVPDIMDRVEHKVKDECGKGCMVACNTFPLKGMQHVQRRNGVWFYLR